MLKGNKIIVSFIATVVILTTLTGFSLVKADSINDIAVTSGVINVLVNFTVPSSSDTVYIKFDTDSDPTNGIQTYTDPTDLLNGIYYGNGGTSRHMFIRGLDESTTYSYAIYLNGVLDTSAPYPTFTTLDRYTNESGWGDEFFDEYLIDVSSSIGLHQNTPTKHGSKIDDLSSTGWNMISIINANNRFNLFTGLPSPVDYSYNVTGTSFNGSYTSTGVTCSENEICWDEDNDRYVLIKQYTEGGSGGTQDIHVGNTTIGSETSWGAITKIYSQGSAEYEPVTINHDPLGVNNFIMSIIWHSGTGLTPRNCCLFLQIPDGTYNSWVMIDGNSQHRTYADGIGFTGEQLAGNDGSYGMSSMVRNQMYIGLLQVLENDATSGGRGCVFLTYSRNGYDWHIFETNPDVDTDTLIPFGNSGTWDDGYIRPDNMVLHTVGDTDRIYWSGKDTPHGSGATSSGLSYSTVRTQGLTYAKPTLSTAYIRTINIPRWFTKNFTVNGDFTDTNKLNISVLKASDNSVYSGFDNSDFNTITTDGTSISCSWGSNTLDDIPDGEFKLKFTFDGSEGTLFSYNIDGKGTLVDSISFVSINGQQNNTNLQDKNRTFIWNIVPGTTEYSIRISNHSDFHAEIFLQLDNISLAEWGSEYYSEANGNVTFILPDQYNITDYGYNYYQVRSYS